MADDECAHLLPLGQCDLCRPLPAGVRPHGFHTRGRHAFHNDPNCPWLASGQRGAELAGQQTHEVVAISWDRVLPGDLEPCEYCCTPQWLQQHRSATTPGKPCEVLVATQWLPGELRWANGRRRDGRWWASVAYRKDGATITEQRDESELRRRG